MAGDHCIGPGALCVRDGNRPDHHGQKHVGFPAAGPVPGAGDPLSGR